MEKYDGALPVFITMFMFMGVFNYAGMDIITTFIAIAMIIMICVVCYEGSKD